MLGSLVQLLVAAFVMGFVAAAPIGPVNMLAIRRGVIGKWTHTLACGSGSAMGDLLIFSLVLLGGSRLDLSRPGVRITLAVAGVVVLIPLSVYFVTRGLRNPLRSFVRSRRRLQGNPPKHLIADAATGGAADHHQSRSDLLLDHRHLQLAARRKKKRTRFVLALVGAFVDGGRADQSVPAPDGSGSLHTQSSWPGLLPLRQLRLRDHPLRVRNLLRRRHLQGPLAMSGYDDETCV